MQARKNAPSVVVIEDLDFLGRTSSEFTVHATTTTAAAAGDDDDDDDDSSSSSSSSTTLGQEIREGLLKAMDELATEPLAKCGVLVIGA